ncbi:MAG: FxDxF family PEP-CTERM protein [Ferribacterium limneticum]
MNSVLFQKCKLPLLVILVSLLSPLAHANTTVFSTDFETTIPAEISHGSASLTGVQGFAGLGEPGNLFAGSFLRSMTGNVVTLELSNLPTHSAISVGFLFAAIDSLDGTGSFPSGDFFKVSLDGQQIFRESFANAMSSQTQSYVPPASVQLVRRIDLGFSGPGSFYTDSAYNLGADPTFANIAHTASTALFSFTIEGNGIQDLNDESWAMDNLRISVTPVPEPESYAMLLAGLGLVGLVAQRRRSVMTSS